LAAAGAIIEGIEFWAAETPNGSFTSSNHAQLSESKGVELLPLQDYPLALDNVLDENTPLAWEMVTKLGDSENTLAWMPSNMVWLRDRIVQQFLDVQQSSNGLASGTTLEDAILQGLYEVIERDSWTINQFVRETLGIPPTKVPLAELPNEMAWAVQLMRRAGLYPVLYDCSSDLGIPSFGCALFGRDGVGLFGGYGAHLNPQVAAQRALLECVQSRLCYISGARDDLYRRDFILMKRHNSDRLIGFLETVAPAAPSWPEFIERYPSANFEGTKEELAALLSRLKVLKIDKLYYRQLAHEDFERHSLFVVKVIATQLEGAWCENWKSNGRAVAHLARVSNA